jgi:hypothetical protein
MDIRSTIEYFAAEGKVIAKAPVVFTVALAFLGGSIYGALTWYYSALLTIKEEQIKNKDNQLKGKDDQLSEYRERLHILPPAQSSYARLTNAELRQKASSVAQQLHQAIERCKKEDERLRDTRFSFPEGASEEEKSRLWSQYTQRMSQPFRTLLSDYNSHFKIEVILLRDELGSRLAGGQGGASEWQFFPNDPYENPVNLFGLEQVMSDLDTLIQLLPDKGES